MARFGLDNAKYRNVFTQILARGQASIDCAKASKLSEKLICGNSTLIELDANLAKKYGNNPSSADRKAQRAWIKERDKCQIKYV
jgi:uncharacterized protein